MPQTTKEKIDIESLKDVNFYIMTQGMAVEHAGTLVSAGNMERVVMVTSYQVTPQA